MKKFLKYGLIILGWLLVAIILLTVVAGLLIQTRPVKKKIAVIVENKASEIVNGKISVGEIDGNFFNALILKNVLWSIDDDTIAFVEEVNAAYQLRSLLSGELLIQNAHISKPYFYLKQENDSTWNVQNLINQTENKKVSEDNSSANFSLEILNFEIFDGRVKNNAIDTVIPREINHLNTQFSLGYSSEVQNLELINLSFRTLNPSLSLNQLSLNVMRNKEEIELRDLYVKTTQNKLEGNADYMLDTVLNASGNIKSEPLQFTEFEFLFPGFKFPVSPTFEIKTDIKKGGLNARVFLVDGMQKIDILLNSENLFRFLNNTSEIKLSYAADINLQKVDLAYWLGDPKLNYLVNGKLEIDGEGTDPKTATFILNGDLNESLIKEKLLNELQINSLKLENGKLDGKITAAAGEQKANFNLQSENFTEFLANSSKNQLKYNISGNLKNVDLEHWLGDLELNYLINGKINIKGEGTDPKTATSYLEGDFRNITIHGKPVDKLLASLHLKNGNLDGKVEGEGKFGLIDIKPVILDLQGNPNYQFELTTKNFNLAELNGNDSLQSDINLTANIEGISFNPEKIQVGANIKLSKSKFQDMSVDTLIGQVHYFDKNIQIDSLFLETQTVLLEASGNYNMDGISDFVLKTDFSGVEEFERFIPAEEIFARGEINAHVKGITDSLNVKAIIDLNDVLYDSLTAEKLVINVDGYLTQKDTTVTGKISAEKLKIDKLLVESMDFDVNYISDSLFVRGRAKGDEIETNLAAGVRFGEQQQISLENWSINYKNQHFHLQNSPAVFELDSTQYKISSFNLVSKNSDSAQFISANGIISRTGKEDFHLKIANINIQQFLEIFEPEFEASGNLDLDAEIKGTATSPLITGEFVVDETILNGYKFTDFGGNLNFQKNKLYANFNMVPDRGGKFELKSEFPMLVKRDSLKFKLNPGDSLNANLVIEQFPLAVLPNIKLARGIKGFIEGSVDVKGTLEAPNPKGNFHLIDASLEVPEFGIDYKNMTLNIDFLPEAVKLDSFYIRSEDGTMKATGMIDFNTAFYRGDVSESEVNVKFKNFNPVNHQQFNMQLSGDANIKGKKGDVVFGGNLNIPESELYLPAIFSMLGRQSADDIPDPILIREMKKMENQVDSITVQVDTLKVNGFDFSYFDNFTGSLNLKIPKNSWIKNKDMHIEISGDLELRKNAEFFELFGSVDVVRGQYDLFGKTFIIDEGSMNFQGGEELMPQIDITASYSFRNAKRAEQEISVHATGTAEEPSVNFSLDGSNVSEGDALSYILFGKSMDELSIDQQQNMTGAGSLAGTAAAAILSSRITNYLNEKIDVDYIEIKSDGEFDNATVVVGKYITNDLFVSYQQRFGETDEKEMAKYEVKLEYELFKFLFLQLNNSSKDSGFDVIFKLTSE